MLVIVWAWCRGHAFFCLEKKKKERKRNAIVSKISLDTIDEIQKNSKDEKDVAASNPNWLSRKVSH